MSLEPIKRNGGSASFAVFTLYGDYLIPFNGGAAWSQELIYLLGLLEMPERTVRTTLARMKNRGWFEVEKQGRRSRYILTQKGRDVLEQGRQRIFEPVTVEWDELWQVVVYSLPEEKRSLRDEFRKKLVWFGFGNLAGGTWIGSHDRRTDLLPIAEELGISSYVSLFESRRVGMMTNQEIVNRCWDLTALSKKYREFVTIWQPRLTAFSKMSQPPSPEFRFQEGFWLTFDFQPFPRLDPNLPIALLPTDWPGHTAKQLFDHYRQHLRLGLRQYFDELPT